MDTPYPLAIPQPGRFTLLSGRVRSYVNLSKPHVTLLLLAVTVTTMIMAARSWRLSFACRSHVDGRVSGGSQRECHQLLHRPRY